MPTASPVNRLPLPVSRYDRWSLVAWRVDGAQPNTAAQVEVEVLGGDDPLGRYRIHAAVQRKQRPQSALSADQQLGRLGQVLRGAAVDIDLRLGHMRQQRPGAARVIHMDVRQHDMPHVGRVDA